MPKGKWYVVETLIPCFRGDVAHYSRPLAYREATLLMGEMTRLKYESRLWTVRLTGNQYAECNRFADAGVCNDYSTFGGLQ